MLQYFSDAIRVLIPHNIDSDPGALSGPTRVHLSLVAN
jgi:hypothetical protein